MSYVPNQNRNILEVILAGFNLDAVKTFRHLHYFKITLPPLQNSFPFLCHFITHNREYYE